MIPSTRPADLDHVHRELGMMGGELLELLGTTGRAGDLTQPLPEHPGDLGQLLLAADRAGPLHRLAVETGGALQVGTRVTDRGEGRTTGLDVRQERTSLQGVVHHLSRAEHPTSVRAGVSGHGPEFARAVTTLSIICDRCIASI